MDKIKVDLDQMEIGDIRFFLDAQGSDDPETIGKILDVLDRVVIGGVDHLKVTQIMPVIEAVNQAMTEMADPKN